MANKKSSAFKRLRWLTGLTQQEVAIRARISQTALSDLETGTKVNPSWEILGRLALLYGCSPYDLLPLKFRPKPATRRFVLGTRKGKA